MGRLFDICALAGKVTWFDLQMDKEGKSKGMAVCEYSHPIEAVQAVSMLNNQRLLDRTIAIRMDRYPKDTDRNREPGGLPVCFTITFIRESRHHISPLTYVISHK